MNSQRSFWLLLIFLVLSLTVLYSCNGSADEISKLNGVSENFDNKFKDSGDKKEWPPTEHGNALLSCELADTFLPWSDAPDTLDSERNV